MNSTFFASEANISFVDLFYEFSFYLTFILGYFTESA
jgi:hypothetical protein